MPSHAADLTQLLAAWSHGDSQAAEVLLPEIYDELRRMARNQLIGERSDHTLQPTALVHATFLRMVRQQRVEWQSRRHFLAVAISMMRRILVDHARARRAEKRGGGAPLLTLEGLEEVPTPTSAPAASWTRPRRRLRRPPQPRRPP